MGPGKFYLHGGKADMRALDAMAAAMNPVVGNDADFDKLTEVPLISQPGTCYRDSIAPTVIAHIICKITGRPLPAVVSERILQPLEMVDTNWFVPAEKQSRVACNTEAAPWLTNRLWGNYFTGAHSGHTSWLGWVAKDSPQSVPDTCPQEITDQTRFYSTAVEQIRFHSMLLAGGLTSSGSRVLSEDSVRLMTTDQIQSLGHDLADVKFNSHAADKSNSSGAVSPQFGKKAEGQSLGFGLQVITRPVQSRLAGSRGTFSSWGFNGTECWTDPALELSVFVGTQLSPFWALPEMRQEIAGAVYGSLVSTSAAKHVTTGQGDTSGGAMGQMMNMMMMMSLLGGGGMMGMTGGAAAGNSAASPGGGV